METVTRKIGNSVGATFPKEISPVAGQTFTILKIGDSYVMKPKKENIFEDANQWEGFRSSLEPEDVEWDEASLGGKES